MAIYLSIHNIKGSITAQGYQGCIQVFNYHSRHFRPITERPSINSNRTLGTHDRSSLRVSKKVDISTPPLLSQYYNSTSIPALVFHHVTTGNNPQCYLENTFHHVLLTGFEEFCCEDGATEEIEMVFMSQEKRVMNMASDHTLSSPQSVGYDYGTMQSI